MSDFHLFAPLHAQERADLAAEYRNTLADRYYVAMIRNRETVAAAFDALCADPTDLLDSLAGLDLCGLLQGRAAALTRVGDVVSALLHTELVKRAEKAADDEIALARLDADEARAAA